MTKKKFCSGFEHIFFRHISYDSKEKIRNNRKIFCFFPWIFLYSLECSETCPKKVFIKIGEKNESKLFRVRRTWNHTPRFRGELRPQHSTSRSYILWDSNSRQLVLEYYWISPDKVSDSGPHKFLSPDPHFLKLIKKIHQNWSKINHDEIIQFYFWKSP